MLDRFNAENHLDGDGNPAGGSVNGIGLSITWQDGPLGRGKPGFEVLGRLAALMEVPPSALRPEIATLFKTNGTTGPRVPHRQ